MTLSATRLAILPTVSIATNGQIHAISARPIGRTRVRNGEGCSPTGPRGRNRPAHRAQAKDKFIVRDAETENDVWWGKTNVGMSPAHFAALKADFLAALAGKDRLYVADLFGGSQPEHRVNVRVINELAWHTFVRTLLVRPTPPSWKASAPNIPSSTCRLPRRSRTPWLPQRDDVAVNFSEADHRRHAVRRRDEEVGVRHPQLSAPRRWRDADALFGKHRSQG
jgi:hypothetical protein